MTKPHEWCGFPSVDGNLRPTVVSIGFDRLRRFSRLYCHQNSHQRAHSTERVVRAVTFRGDRVTEHIRDFRLAPVVPSVRRCRRGRVARPAKAPDPVRRRGLGAPRVRRSGRSRSPVVLRRGASLAAAARGADTDRRRVRPDAGDAVLGRGDRRRPLRAARDPLWRGGGVGPRSRSPRAHRRGRQLASGLVPVGWHGADRRGTGGSRRTTEEVRGLSGPIRPRAERLSARNDG